MVCQRSKVSLFLLLGMLAVMAMAMFSVGKMATAIPTEVTINRNAQREQHLEARHGVSALTALLAVRVCPEPFALYCHNNFFRVDAIAIGCRAEDGRCAFCIVGLDGSLKTCYVRRDCNLDCDPIPMPRVQFPALCTTPGQSDCITEDDIKDSLTFLVETNPEEIRNICTDNMK